MQSGRFTAGQAYVHAAPVTHLATSEGGDAIFVYFNLPHRDHSVPVAGNQNDAIDFTRLPPAGCPRPT